MPIYEYRCNGCGHKLEALQKLADAPLIACPACGKDALTKLVSAAGFQLKGSGWYATDFKGSGSKPAEKPTTENGGDGKSAAATASAGESKTETKGDAKPASTSTVTPPAAPSTPATGSDSSSA